MRVNIMYTDYKNNKLYNQIIKYNLKNENNTTENNTNENNTTENNTNESIFTHGITRNCVNIDKSYCLCDKVNEYVDTNGNINYRIDIQPQFRRRKSKKLSEIDQLVNTVCDTLYINVLTDGISMNDTMTIMVDESKLLLDESITIPDISISVNVYDNIGIFDMIKLYQINKI